MKERFFILRLVVSLVLLVAIAPGTTPTMAAQPRRTVPVAPNPAADLTRVAAVRQITSAMHTGNVGQFAGEARSQVRDGGLRPRLKPSGPCEVSGIIDNDTMWSPAECDPYVVTGNVGVHSEATLTIQPGTTVKFDSLKALSVAGTLVVCGTEDNRITFTSNQPSPAKGDWAYILFTDSSADASPDRDCSGNGSGSILQYAVIEYAGGAGGYHAGALFIEASSPLIAHNIIRDNDNGGISVFDDGAPRITNNTITGNSVSWGGGISIWDASPTISNNPIISNTAVWGGGIYVNISFGDTVSIANNTVSGNSASNGGGIYVYSGNPTISSNTITNNFDGGGIWVYSGSPTISNNTITNNVAGMTNRGGGIHLSNGSRPTISDNNLYSNMTGDPANTPNDFFNGNDFGGDDVDAENNYWGTTDRDIIEDHIWHFMDDPSLGYVDFIPFRSLPVPPPMPAAPVERVTISGPTAGIVNTPYTFIATASPLTATQPITYLWQTTDQPSQTHVGGRGDAVSFTWDTPGTQAITVTADNGLSTVSDTHTIAISPLSEVPVERVAINGPTTGTGGTLYTFTATVSPITATQPITYAWHATGQSPVTHVGGPSDTVTFAWSTAGTKIITVTASNTWDPAIANHAIAISEPGRDAYEPDDACAQASTLATNGTAQHHTFHQHADEDWARFTVTSGITYVLQATSTSPGADLVIELYDACGGNLEGFDDDGLGADARLMFPASSGGTYYARALNHDPAVYGPGVTYDLSAWAQSQAGVAIIVAGRKYSPERLQSNINHIANQAFRVFKNGGILPEDIYYLHHDASQDADEDGSPDVDGTATASTLEYALTTWAVPRAGPGTPLYLYLVDHGTNDLFMIDGRDDAVTPTQLDGWLTTLESATGCPVNVFIESCKSGSFIAAPQEISKPGRVIVTSAAAHQTAHAYRDGKGAYFSNHFLSLLSDNADLWTCYTRTHSFLEGARLGQTPWLDDNGDAVSDNQDGTIARQRGLISPTLGAIPWIASVSPPVKIDGYTAAITATVHEDGPTPLVWAEVIAPSYRATDPEDEMAYVDVPKILLEDGDGDGTYTGNYGGFTEIGEYRVVVYARDSDGNQGLPRTTTVRTGWRVFLPLALSEAETKRE